MKGRALRPLVMQVNNIYALMLSVEVGMGIAALPNYMVKGHPTVKRVLPDVHGPTVECFFVYPEELRNMKRLNVFRNFILDKVREWQADEGEF